jgi:hypothetical protein
MCADLRRRVNDPVSPSRAAELQGHVHSADTDEAMVASQPENNMVTGPKPFKLRPEQIKQLVAGMGGCVASDRITVEGKQVGSMVREAPDRADDSGWVFLAGDESQVYLDEPNNLSIYDVNTIANYDPSIIPYLYALPGQCYDRVPRTDRFVEAPDSAADHSAARLPPGQSVVQGHVGISDDWSIDLPTPFRRRLEDGSLVIWRPSLTFWIDVVRTPGASVGDSLNMVRADASPNASDLRASQGNGLARFSYRVREDTTDAKTPSLYAFIIASQGYVQLGVYGDREDDLRAARSIVDSVHGA